MTLMTPIRPDANNALRKAPTRETYIGHYMPFAGVKYYAIFDKKDIIKGKIEIGPVGWRLSKAPDNDAERLMPIAA